jgi:hypothetical protein
MGARGSAATSDAGSQIAAVATRLAGDLREPQNRAFDPATAQSVWNPPGWGQWQCVAFADGVYRQVGVTLPAAPNATDFWSAAAGRRVSDMRQWLRA